MAFKDKWLDMSFASVSVVIPCFKSQETIGRAVESVFNQTLIPSEVILVDDCSPDETLVEMKLIQQKYPVGWIQVIALPDNVGAGSTRNRGWDVAKGDYVAFLDSDDSWHPRKIEMQYSWMRANRDVVLTGHAYRVVEEKNCRHIEESLLGVQSFREVSVAELLFFNRFSTPTVMLRRDLPFRFEEGKRYSEDYLLWLEIALSGNQCYRSSDELAFLYKQPYGASGLSASLWKMEVGQLDTYMRIYKKGLVGVFALVALIFFSLAKYLRRVLLVLRR